MPENYISEKEILETARRVIADYPEKKRDFDNCPLQLAEICEKLAAAGAAILDGMPKGRCGKDKSDKYNGLIMLKDKYKKRIDEAKFFISWTNKAVEHLNDDEQASILSSFEKGRYIRSEYYERTTAYRHEKSDLLNFGKYLLRSLSEIKEKC